MGSDHSHLALLQIGVLKTSYNTASAAEAYGLSRVRLEGVREGLSPNADVACRISGHLAPFIRDQQEAIRRVLHEEVVIQLRARRVLRAKFPPHCLNRVDLRRGLIWPRDTGLCQEGASLCVKYPGTTDSPRFGHLLEDHPLP